MNVAVLCGGTGYRLLGEEGKVKQKCCVEVNGKPFLSHRIDQLLRNGASTIVLVTEESYIDDVENVMERFYSQDEVSCTIKGLDMGMAGGVAAGMAYFGESFWVANGDTYLETPIPNVDNEWVMVTSTHKNVKKNIVESNMYTHHDAGMYKIGTSWPPKWKYMPTSEYPYHINTVEDKMELEEHLANLH